MTDSLISSTRSSTALPRKEREILMKSFRATVNNYEGPRYGWALPVHVGRKLTLGEESTIFRSIAAGHIRTRKADTALEVLLGHPGLATDTLRRIVERAEFRQTKTMELLLQQENLTKQDRLLGLLRVLQRAAFSRKLEEIGQVTRADLDLIDGIHNHWGSWLGVRIPHKLVQEIVELSPGQTEIFTMLLQDNRVAPDPERHEHFRSFLRAAQQL